MIFLLSRVKNLGSVLCYIAAIIPICSFSQGAVTAIAKRSTYMFLPDYKTKAVVEKGYSFSVIGVYKDFFRVSHPEMAFRGDQKNFDGYILKSDVTVIIEYYVKHRGSLQASDFKTRADTLSAKIVWDSLEIIKWKGEAKLRGKKSMSDEPYISIEKSIDFDSLMKTKADSVRKRK